METKRKEIRDVTIEELKEFFLEKGEKPFRAQQAYDWIWKKQAHSFDEMSNLSKEIRAEMKKHFDFNSLTIDVIQKSADGTQKIRFKTFDGHFIESVLIPTPHRLTACISSQIGCSLTCKFCATGKMERERNLFFYEIFDQAAFVNQLCLKEHDKKLTNIVYMGMGEPLLNYKSVMKSVGQITSPNGMAMSPSRLTVSTAGIAKQIRQMGDDKVKFNVALSLHAADDEKRSKLMPINDTNNLKEVIDALDYYFSKTKNTITYEYLLLDGVNDSLEDAKNLVKLYRRVPSMINVIEYNPVFGVPYEKTREKKFDEFIDYLTKQKVNVRVRRSRGKDIDAACGQLANKCK